MAGVSGNSIRKVAVHNLRFQDSPDSHRYQVIELCDGFYRAHYPLEGEPAMTEWLGGTAMVNADNSVTFLPC